MALETKQAGFIVLALARLGCLGVSSGCQKIRLSESLRETGRLGRLGDRERLRIWTYPGSATHAAADR